MCHEINIAKLEKLYCKLCKDCGLRTCKKCENLPVPTACKDTRLAKVEQLSGKYTEEQEQKEGNGDERRRNISGGVA